MTDRARDVPRRARRLLVTTLSTGVLATALVNAPASSAAPARTAVATDSVAAAQPTAGIPGAPTAAVPARRTARVPRIRIGEVLQESPRQRYRFRGKKGQRIILMPDGWPAQDHGCVANAQLSRGKTKVAQGAVGDWRLPRAGTYVLRIGDFCVDELDLRLRRHQQTKGSLRGTLPTRLTHQLLRSVRLRLPADRTVVLEQRSNGEAAYVTNAKPDGFPFLGCTTHVITAGLKRPCIAGDKVARRVIVSAPRPSKARVATIVPARVDGPAVTIEDPATTLVQVEIPGRTALRVEGNATPHASGERPWASLYSRVGDGDGWHLTAYESETADGARLPSGWTIDKAGTYVFQVNGHLAGTGPQSFAVRTSPNPPPGETRW